MRLFRHSLLALKGKEMEVLMIAVSLHQRAAVTISVQERGFVLRRLQSHACRQQIEWDAFGNWVLLFRPAWAQPIGSTYCW